MKILVTDRLAEEGLAVLREQATVDLRYDLSRKELLGIIPDYDALIVRSGTQVTAEMISAGQRLQVIARAGVGLDNVDVEAATARGIAVVNAPTANTHAAAEHTIAMMLALARHIPQANRSLRKGEWTRSRFVGVQVRDKTLGIVGVGRIGSEVARRARALGMRVLGYDPYVTRERAQQAGCILVSLEDLVAQSDFLSLHPPLTDATRGMIDEALLRLARPNLRLINCARGGIVDEAALLRALDEGRIAGAALDVFAQEPPGDNPLLRHPKVIATPHLGGSTEEAQVGVAVDVAGQVLALLRGELAEDAVNLPMVPPETLDVLRPYGVMAERLGRFLAQMAEGQLGPLRITYGGALAALDTSLLRAQAIKGLLEPASDDRVNLVNAHLIAQRHGLTVSEERIYEVEPFTNLITLTLTAGGEEQSVVGTVRQGQPLVVQVGPFWVEFEPRGELLVLFSKDRPGMIGQVGSTLGRNDINIAQMTFGRNTPRGRAIMVLRLDEPLPPRVADDLRAIPDLWELKAVRL